jgi:DNA-binding MarR family transcriptional regulator
MLDLEDFLPYRLSVLSNLVSRGIARTYEDRFGLSVTEWRIVAILGRYPGIAATEVAERAAMDKVAVSRAVSRLLEAGRIEREDNHRDRRAKRLFLSRAGQEVYDAIVPAALDYERALLGCLDREQRRVFDECLSRLTEAAARRD